MSEISGFLPISDGNARFLVLGSMPGERSLMENQYYAHPQNQFWRIMTRLLKVKAMPSYKERIALLKENQIALWDVLHSCIRTGSLDSDIRQEVVNDFAAFFEACPRITTILFNGKKAEQSFRRHVLPVIDCNGFSFHVLPSTSPAHASLSFDRKYGVWRKAFRP